MNRWIGLAGVVAGLSVGVAAPASADPPPYPDISRYAKVDFEGFKIANQPGVWFSSPFGLNCGIWDDSSFGCTGNIPGSPAGTNQIGWFSGDSAAHFDNTDQPRFSAGSAQRVLPANNYLEYSGSRCATTPDNAVYCVRYGNDKFMVSPTQSWLGS
ncbi:hypothetical protein ACAG26_16440 [Mycobacterium sp. pUA109]|uniref:hypothetical protein n=1 Tax=Mycobacterium sp. pUA109 TaxID=3238982 RepID=UPI00351B820D